VNDICEWTIDTPCRRADPVAFSSSFSQGAIGFEDFSVKFKIKYPSLCHNTTGKFDKDRDVKSVHLPELILHRFMHIIGKNGSQV